MRTFQTFIRKYRLYVAFALAMMLIELFIEIMQPYMMSKIIDQGIITGNTDAIMFWGGLLLATTVIAFAVGILSSFYSAHVSQSFGYDMRQSLYEKVQRMSIQMFSGFQEASLMTRMTNDVTQVQNAVFMGMRVMLRAPLLVLGSIFLAFLIEPSLAIYLLIVLPVLAIFLGWVMHRNHALFKKVQNKLDQVNRVMQQSLLSIRLIRVFVRMDHEQKRFDKQNEELRNRTVATLRLAELTMPIVLVLLNGCILIILWVAKDKISQGDAISVGEIVAIVNYAMRISGALSMISMIVTNLSRAAASMQRIDEVFDVAQNEKNQEEEQAANKKRDTMDGSIRYSKVNLSYPNSELHTLSDISFIANKGEMVAILGSTGSGKSTLLQLLLRMYDSNEGTITVGDKPIDAISLQELRTNIGYVPQEVLLFSGTVADNIRWGNKHATIEEIMQATKMAQIHDTIMKLPNGYDTMIGQKGVNLSGGQKQRITIARALVRKPNILLLDDCTSALDVETENKLLAEIRKLSCTVLLVTQKVSSTVLANKIVIMDDGRVLASGHHNDLLEHSELYQKICHSQIGARRDTKWAANGLQKVIR